jgi:hypothetical protein
MKKKKITKEIESITIFNAYSLVVAIAKYTPIYKWALGAAFILGAVDILLDGTASLVGQVVLFSIWMPAIVFGLVGGVLHFLTGKKIKYLQEKYKLSEESVLKEIDQVLAKK